MNRKSEYKDLEKHRKTCHAQKRRYYGKTAFAKNGGSFYSEEELELIQRHDITDTELAKMLNRSVNAIQIKRSRLRANKEAV